MKAAWVSVGSTGVVSSVVVSSVVVSTVDADAAVVVGATTVSAFPSPPVQPPTAAAITSKESPTALTVDQCGRGSLSERLGVGRVAALHLCLARQV